MSREDLRTYGVMNRYYTGGLKQKNTNGMREELSLQFGDMINQRKMPTIQP